MAFAAFSFTSNWIIILFLALPHTYTPNLTSADCVCSLTFCRQQRIAGAIPLRSQHAQDTAWPDSKAAARAALPRQPTSGAPLFPRQPRQGAIWPASPKLRFAFGPGDGQRRWICIQRRRHLARRLPQLPQDHLELGAPINKATWAKCFLMPTVITPGVVLFAFTAALQLPCSPFPWREICTFAQLRRLMAQFDWKLSSRKLSGEQFWLTWWNKTTWLLFILKTSSVYSTHPSL